MLGRLITLSRGTPVPPNLTLPMREALGAYGDLLPPPANPAKITTATLAQTSISPTHPPGIYGSGGTAVALNLGGHIPIPALAQLPHAEPLGGQVPPITLGSLLVAGAILLLTFDLLISLRLRGLIRWPGRAMLAGLVLIAALQGEAQAQNPPTAIPPAALQTQLAYIRSGDPAADQMSGDALAYLSALVSDRSSAQLSPPVGVDPSTDPLNLYPMIYWPVLPGTVAPSDPACAALNSYMQHGGLLLIDSQGSDAGAVGSGAGFTPGAGAAITRATACLDLPPLEPLTTANAIAHSFYIVQSFPGKFVGAPVLIADAAARDADGVTPIIIGQNDWAAAWAHNATGLPEQTPIPGGDDQRVTADRFGTNLVIYALTGDYKADQSHLPAFLDRLGQ